MKKLMGWQPEQFDNRYAATIGIMASIGHIWINGKLILNIPVDVLIIFMKAAIGGAGGMVGKWLYGLIRKAVITLITYYKKRKNEKTP